MEWYVHPDAVDEFLELPQEVREALRENVDSRMRREKEITDQRGVGLAHDSHGNPLYYFKVEEENYRVFFDISESRIVMLGFRPRDEDTYIDIRKFTKRFQGY